MGRRSKKNYIVIGLLLLACISIGYAVLNTTLNITGKSSISKNTWNVHFENVQITTGSVEATKDPVIENSTTVDFEVGLKLPGDFYEFTVDVVNSGTIDAMIESITKEPELSIEQQKYLNYTIDYYNEEEIKNNQLVKADEFVRFRVRIEIKTDVEASDLPEVGDILNLRFTLNYVQADESGIIVKNNGVRNAIANGSLDEIGTIVTIGNQQFYTIGIDGENVKLLSMWNITLGDNPRQNLNPNNTNGTPFSSSTQKGTNYNDYHGSIVEGYVNKYKNKLETNGVEIIEARLITHREFFDDKLGCDFDSKTCLDTPYSWLYSSNYWTSEQGLGASDIYIYVVNGKEMIFSTAHLYSSSNFGVRPVIVVPKSEIIVDISNDDIDKIGTVLTIGTEKFYTIGTEGNNVKLISMYNLYVGGECTASYPIQCRNYGEEATGMQDENMLGSVDGQDVAKGVTAFSSDEQKGINYNDYEGSIVESYVNDYKVKLEEKFNVDVLEARLITEEELSNPYTFNCSGCDYCSKGYPFIYSTSYWTKSIPYYNSLYIVSTDGYFGYMDGNYNWNYYYGVRPVIVISKDYFK